jgi:DNA-binding response OmpR family regulator
MSKLSTGQKRILVVEDEASLSRLCQQTLTGQGFAVDTAANGEVAMRMLGKKDYDLILLDIKTPVMNGKQLYHYLKEKFPARVARIMFTTGDTVSEENRAFVEQSGRPLLAKPFTPGELKEIVAWFLEKTA